MRVKIIQRETRQGAKGKYLYIKYVKEDGTESGKAIFSTLEGDWPLCQEGEFLDLKLDDKYNVINILPSDSFDITSSAEASQKAKEETQVKPGEPAPQELGMWYKELGLRIGDGSIERDFPKSFVRIKLEYYKKMSQVTGVSFKEKEE